MRRTDVPSLVGILQGVAPHICEIYTSCDFTSFLPACLFSLRTSTGQTNRDNVTHNCSKDEVWRKEVPSQQVFFLLIDVFVVILPKNPKILPQLGNLSQILKVE